MNKRLFFVISTVVFVAGCSSTSIKSINECGNERTSLDGTCVSHGVADYVSCVRSQSVELGEKKNRSIKLALGYFGGEIGGAKEVSEKLNKKYSTSDSVMKEVIQRCDKLARISSIENFTLSEHGNHVNIIGSWSGSAIENGRTNYQIEMIIERLEVGEYSGKTTYRGSFNCGGLNSLKSIRAGVYVFDEVITSGSSCSSGRVEVYETNQGKLRWEWFNSGRSGNPEAYAILERDS